MFAPADIMMGVLFVCIEGLRHLGIGGLEQPIESAEADSFKDW